MPPLWAVPQVETNRHRGRRRLPGLHEHEEIRGRRDTASGAPGAAIGETRRRLGDRLAERLAEKAGSASIENLPFELQRNFQLMRDLDQRTEDLKVEIDKLAGEYISHARTLGAEQKLQLVRQIQSAYSKCKEFGDDKVQLAMQTYEMEN
ncbi:inhibitor of growth protein 4-like [Mobula hypostoma]|uniref:inhibitor of growth protein 4-like n=1 Tax=Mobula hypostoma TaxID=723540 RepID=UPI002FC28B5C